MNANATTADLSAKDKTVTIVVNEKATSFDYDALKTFHQGDSWFGCTVGFRAMQLAARELSDPEHGMWSRNNLSIISGHPGCGVKDAIELITATVSSEHYQLLDNIGTQDCNRNMRFEWWISTNGKTIHIKLHDNIVPESFFELLDRINTDDETSEDRNNFDMMKSDLSNTVWSQSLDDSFGFELSSLPPNHHTNSEVTT